MLNVLRKFFKCFFGFIFNLLKPKSKKETSKSTIHAHQEASLGFLFNIHNNINMYSINVKHNGKNNDKIKDIQMLEEMKNRLENHLIYGDMHEIEDIKTLR